MSQFWEKRNTQTDWQTDKGELIAPIPSGVQKATPVLIFRKNAKQSSSGENLELLIKKLVY